MSPYRDDLEALEIRRAALAREVEAKRRELDEAARLVDESKALARLPVLDGIRVAAPCTQAWTAMTGDARVRHCAACDQRVYDLSELTRAEAQALIVEKEGRLCVRFYQRADGTILLADCSIGVHRRRRQRLVAAGAAAAGVVALLAGGAAGYLAVGSPADDVVAEAAPAPADDRARAVELERMRAHAAQVAAERAMQDSTMGVLSLTVDELEQSNSNLAVAVDDAKVDRKKALAAQEATLARAQAALAAAQAATASAEAAQRAQAEAEAELEAARARTRALEQRLQPVDKLEP